MVALSLSLNNIEHLDGGLYGSLRLVGIEAAGLEGLALVLPRDDGLHECVGAAARGDGDGVVGEHGELAAQRLLIDLAQGTHEGVVLSVATGVLLVHLVADAQLERSHGLEALREGDVVAQELHTGILHGVFQHIGDDVGKVFLRDYLLLVAQLDDACGDLAHGLIVEFEAQGFEVLAYVGLAAGLAQCIFALASEALGEQLVAVEVVLVVAVGMHACHLSKDVLTHDGFVGGDGDARVGLHEAAHIVETLLIDGGFGTEVVAQDGLHAGQGSIARTFAQAVDRSMETLGTSQHSGIHVAHGKVVVVVGMEVEVGVGVAIHHHAHELLYLHGIENAEGVREHEAAYTTTLQTVHQLEHVVGRVLHAVAPVLEVHVHRYALLGGVGYGAAYIGNVLFGSALKLLGTVLERTLGEEVHYTGAATAYPVDRGSAVDEAENLHLVDMSGTGSPVADGLDRLGLTV